MARAHGINVRTISVRSTNVERDLDRIDLTRLNLTGRGNDVLRRIEEALRRPERDRAWSITGPYGSGKSSFALLLSSLVSPDIRRRQAALARIGAADATLGDSFAQTLMEAAPGGMLRAIAAARREPIARTVTRALSVALDDTTHFRGPAVTRARKAVKAINLDGPSHDAAEAILEATYQLNEVAPTLLILDEFGKSLEYQATRATDEDADLYLLQELSELSAGSTGLPMYLLTLQHLGFMDYAGVSDALQRREWSKIQGRFEDVLFVENSNESARLIAQSIQQPTPPPASLARYSTVAAAGWEDAGLARVLAADGDLFANVYPLHPLLTVVAPLVFGALAQNDRTLSGFLAGDEPHTLAEYLRENATGSSGDPASLPSMKLPALYDYLASGARTSLLASSSASRWLEIETRLSDARALPDDDVSLLKAVAVLNLVDAGGALRASADNIAYALLEPGEWADAQARSRVLARLETSQMAAFLHYRAYSDEWRLWQGSDVDLTARIGRIRASLVEAPITQILPASLLPTAVVAGRHAQIVGMLRHFTVAVTDASDELVTAPADDAAEDGLLVFHLGTTETVPAYRGRKPILIGTSPDAKLVIDAALELSACQGVLDTEDLDVPATAELRERLAQARTHLAMTFAQAYRPGRPDAVWSLNGARLDEQRSLSALVSEACDRAYPSSPRIRNEMLGRHTLTSQGARARRVLIELSLSAADEPSLGMDHYGPERAMYEGVIRYLDLHGSQSHGFGFHAPHKKSTVAPAWSALTSALQQAAEGIRVDALYRLLMAPPFGVKSGVVPLLLTAALSVHRDDLAVFDDGTYQPTITAALMERLVKTPERFSIVATAAGRGTRAELLLLFTHALGLSGGNVSSRPKLLRVVNGLLSRIRDLEGYALRTRQVSDAAIALRTASRTATDPARLMFEDLPRAVGKPPVTPKTSDAALKDIVRSVLAAVTELEQVRPRLERDILKTLADAFATPVDVARMRTELAARVSILQGARLEPGLAGLVSHVLNDLPNEDWLEPLALLVAGRAFNSWADEDMHRLANRARQLAASLHEARVLNADQGAHRLLSLTGADGTRQAILLDRKPDTTLREGLDALLATARRRHGEAAAISVLQLLVDDLVATTDKDTL